MSGRAFEIERDVVRDLQRVGFNDRASSLTVLNGYWIFCSERQFRRRLPHLRSGRLSESVVGPRPQDFVRTQDRGAISVRRDGRIGSAKQVRQARYARRNTKSGEVSRAVREARLSLAVHELVHHLRESRPVEPLAPLFLAALPIQGASADLQLADFSLLA